jgi:hypothetical protein
MKKTENFKAIFGSLKDFWRLFTSPAAEAVAVEDDTYNHMTMRHDYVKSVARPTRHNGQPMISVWTLSRSVKFFDADGQAVNMHTMLGERIHNVEASAVRELLRSLKGRNDK